MKKTFFQKYGILIIFLLLCLVLSFLSPVFLSIPNLINVVRQISINGILAIGMTLVDRSLGRVTSRFNRCYCCWFTGKWSGGFLSGYCWFAIGGIFRLC